MCFCSSLVLVFLCFVIVLLLIAMSCHCPVRVRLSLSIKDYLLAYLLTHLYAFFVTILSFSPHAVN